MEILLVLEKAYCGDTATNIREWQNIHGAFQAGVKWTMRHHKMLGMYKNKG